MGQDETTPGRKVRALLRRSQQASLATLLAGEAPAWPYASLVLVALGHDGSPLLLLSDLADHSKNLQRDARAALLFDGTGGWRDPLAGPRASLLGRLEPHADAHLRARFLSRHPSAHVYAGFADFRLYRMSVERAHLVAGFGDIHWLDAPEVLLDTGDCAALAAAEADIVAHMNQDHADAVRAIAGQAVASQDAGDPTADWTMTGIDPEGADFRSEAGIARVPFRDLVRNAQDARQALVALTRSARSGTD